jgi:hypothetical protein
MGGRNGVALQKCRIQVERDRMCDEINHGTVGQLTAHMDVSEYKIPRERQ